MQRYPNVNWPLDSIQKQIYTSKAMAGLLAHVRAGWWHPEQSLIFLHTGGTPALFAYAKDLGY